MNATRNWKAETVAGACELRPLMRDGAALRIRIQLLLLAASLGAGSAITLRAQLVADGATNTLSNATNTITGTVTVGTNGSFTLLVLSDNALLTNSLNGVIGRSSTANSNEVRLVSATARWLVGGDLSVGSNGAMSRLVVSNGARMENNIGSLATSGASSNNLALVTGSGSLWSNRTDVIVGWFGRNNQMVVSNGGRVINVAGGTIGSQVSAPGNVATVTGNGSIWNAGSALTVGYLAASNRLVIDAGGRVDCDTGRVGYNTGSNNLALVTGAGSGWSNVSLQIGGFGPNNQLIVSNGAAVTDVDGFLGHDPGASNNVAWVTGAGSLWTNSDGLLIGYQEGRNQLVVSNGGSVVNRIGHLGYFSIANNNLAVVSGAGSVWSNRLNLNVGFDGSGNRLDVNNGGAVFAGNGVYVGAGDFSANNRVVLDGGTLRATNASGTAVLDVRRGTNVLNSGTIDVDLLVLTNESQGKFEFNGGTLITRGIALATTNPLATFSVNGTGATPATWDVRAGVSNHFLPSLIVGSNSSFNQLLLTNGALLAIARGSYIGANKGADFNLALISGAGSVWSNVNSISIGHRGSFNQLVVSNGALVVSDHGNFSNFGGSNNMALVTGTGSVWRAVSLDLRSGSRVVISNGGTIFVPDGVTARSAMNNRIVVDGGTLLATNGAGTALFEIRGTNVLNSGLIEADLLNTTDNFGLSGSFEFNGGTFKPGSMAYDNGRVFTVGNGASVATLQLRGGTHGFTSGLAIANNSTLTGNGTVVGTVAVFSGGTLSPGDGIGTLIFSNTPNLNGKVLMEVLKIGATRSFDQIQVAGTLFYGGTLTVTNVNVTAFSVGDNFRLFNAAVYGSSFASLNLPPLNAGLGWTNKLLVDGSIEVITVSLSQPKLSSISVSGTNVILSGTNGAAGANYAVLTTTNVATPTSNWVSLVTNQFGVGGSFTFTNPIAPGERQRYFRIRTP